MPPLVICLAVAVHEARYASVKGCKSLYHNNDTDMQMCAFQFMVRKVSAGQKPVPMQSCITEDELDKRQEAMKLRGIFAYSSSRPAQSICTGLKVLIRITPQKLGFSDF